MTIPLALFASSYNEEEANGSTVQNSKSSYTPVKNNKNNISRERHIGRRNTKLGEVENPNGFTGLPLNIKFGLV